MSKEQDSHISKPDMHAQPPGPTHQRHQMAQGHKLNGQSNPYDAVPTSNKIAGQSKQY